MDQTYSESPQIFHGLPKDVCELFDPPKVGPIPTSVCSTPKFPFQKPKTKFKSNQLGLTSKIAEGFHRILVSYPQEIITTKSPKPLKFEKYRTKRCFLKISSSGGSPCSLGFCPNHLAKMFHRGPSMYAPTQTMLKM